MISSLSNSVVNNVWNQEQIDSPPLPEVIGSWNAPKIGKTGRISFKSEEFGSHAGAIYIFLNQQERACYVGRTATTLTQRLSNHNSRINNPSTTGVHAAIRENPTAFSFGVLALFDSTTDDASELERSYITYLQQIGYELYNSDAGGGGGHPLPHDTSFNPLLESPPRLQTLSPGREHMKTTPTKWYPLTEDGFLITPQGRRKRGIYCMHNQESDEWYIGRTDRNLKTRADEHTRCSKKRRLYTEMHENPSEFEIGMLYEPDEKDPSTAKLETYALRKAREKGKKLYNEKIGGGGTTHEASTIAID